MRIQHNLQAIALLNTAAAALLAGKPSILICKERIPATVVNGLAIIMEARFDVVDLKDDITPNSKHGPVFQHVVGQFNSGLEGLKELTHRVEQFPAGSVVLIHTGDIEMFEDVMSKNVLISSCRD